MPPRRRTNIFDEEDEAPQAPARPAALAQVLSEPMVEDVGSEDEGAAAAWAPSSRPVVSGVGDFSAPEPEPIHDRGIAIVPGVSTDAFGRDEFVAFARQANLDAQVPSTLQTQRLARDIDQLDPLTRAFGAKNWVTNPIYSWARDPMGSRYRWTRFFHEEHIKTLIDVFASDSAKIQKEVEAKSKCLSLYNKYLAESVENRASNPEYISLQREFSLLGDVSKNPGYSRRAWSYLPVVRGTTVSNETIALCLVGGHIAELQVRRKDSGVFA